MIILSHRGFWDDKIAKNSIESFERSFKVGFGIETDFRDCEGNLVISHDPPLKNSLYANKLFSLLAQTNKDLPLAINIKADGIQNLIKSALDEYDIHNYFLFDMSVPDAITSIKAGLKIFTRQSEIETSPYLYDQAKGIWIDAFYDDLWITPSLIEQHLDAGKQVCLVSPELHGRPHHAFWERLARLSICTRSTLMLCTDYPDKAHSYFNHEQNRSN
jgi:glycerophosphoryl diester phosphodiesterase